MKAILKFDLSNPEKDDDFDFKLAVKSKDLAFVIYDLNDFLRSEIKRNDSLTDEQYKVYETIQNKLIEFVTDRDVMNITLEMP